MNENIHTKGEADFRQYEQVWQRVAPTLNPWPVTVSTQSDTPSVSSTIHTPSQNTPSVSSTIHTPSQNTQQPSVNTQQPSESTRTAVNTQQPSQNTPSVQTSAQTEESLPGAERNPCCMGTEALTDLDVLTGFIEEELSLRREFQALTQRAPIWARQSLRTFTDAASAHARRLMTVYYLITGETYTPAVRIDRVYVGKWCPALRQRYHDTACTALNYARAAEETTDPCLARVFDELSEQAYRQTSDLLRMLERAVIAQS